jgi:hypothetical protein
MHEGSAKKLRSPRVVPKMLADMQAALVPPELESHQQVEPIAAEAQQGPKLRQVLQRVTVLNVSFDPRIQVLQQDMLGIHKGLTHDPARPSEILVVDPLGDGPPQAVVANVQDAPHTCDPRPQLQKNGFAISLDARRVQVVSTVELSGSPLTSRLHSTVPHMMM